MTKLEAIKIFKKYGILNDILMEPHHSSDLADSAKTIIKKAIKLS